MVVVSYCFHTKKQYKWTETKNIVWTFVRIDTADNKKAVHNECSVKISHGGTLGRAFKCWTEYGVNRLTSMARQFLCLPPASVPSECVLSSFILVTAHA